MPDAVPPPPGGSALDGVHRAMAVWSLVSTAAGAGVRLWAGPRRPVVAAFGTQTLILGLVGVGFAVWRRLDPVRADEPQAALVARQVAAVMVVITTTAGVTLAARPEAAPRWLRWPDRSGVHLRGQGLAIVVQGLASLVLDAATARVLRAGAHAPLPHRTS